LHYRNFKRNQPDNDKQLPASIDCNSHNFGASYSDSTFMKVRSCGSKLVAVVLLCSAVLSGGSIFLPSAAAASTIPVGCHTHGQPAHTPTSHQCCAAGHSPSIVKPYTSAGISRDFSSHEVTPFVADRFVVDRSNDWLFSASFHSSSSPPIAAPLRV
jgi:hypothetical protein